VGQTSSRYEPDVPGTYKPYLEFFHGSPSSLQNVNQQTASPPSASEGDILLLVTAEHLPLTVPLVAEFDE
jgi:hypothetical protein